MNTRVDNASDDTDLLAERLREARNSPRKPFVRGEFRKLAAQAMASRRRRKRNVPPAEL
jgi:hypothetical protein